MKLKLPPTILIFLLLASSPALAKLKTWSAYTSENFVIYTDAREGNAVKLLKEFETFRNIALGMTGTANRPESHRLVIMMYSGRGEYNEIRPSRDMTGFYHYFDNGPKMVVGPSSGMELSVVLYHEYVHHLMNQRMDVNYPRWYMEGMAELLSATTIVGDKFTLGAISQGRANDLVQLGALSVAQLINPGSQTDSSIYQARFYASAWLLTHFLQLSPLGTKSQLKSHTTDYLLRLDQGEDTLEAFVASYGMTPDEMDKELRSYQRQRRVTVLTANINPYEGDIGSRVLSEAERAYLLADMAWQLDKEDVALEYLRELGDDRNNDARALSLHAVLENTYGDPQRASRLRTAALALGEDDSQVHSNLARMDWYSFELSSYALSLDRSLRHGKRAAELDPDNLEAYKYQWMAHAAKGEEVAAISAMMAAFQLYPTSLGINAEIGTYLLHLRKPALARPFLQRVYNWSHSEEQRTALKETLARIDAQIAEEERLTVP